MKLGAAGVPLPPATCGGAEDGNVAAALPPPAPPTADGGPGVRVEVRDAGPGIPESERELVFQPFYRVLGTNVDGSGLGLPIVMEIAQQHAATVTIEEARPGQQPPGACFSVRFVVGDDRFESS